MSSTEPENPGNSADPGHPTKAINFLKSIYADAFRLARDPRQGLRAVHGVSLYRNAGYLIVSTGVTAVTGFVFWIIAARLYPVETVGIGSAIISALGLMAIFPELGLSTGLIRFLPGAGKDGNDMINSCFTLSGLASLAFALVFLAGLHIWSPALLPVRQHPVFFAAFVVFAVTTALQPLANAVFLTKLRARLILITDAFAGILRLPLVAVFALLFSGAFGILASKGLSVAIAISIAILWFLPAVQKGYRPLPTLKKGVLNRLSRYAAGNYVGGVLLEMLPLVLPLVVLGVLGAQMNAYFYIAWAIAIKLTIIPSAIFNSLFAEGSNDEASIRANTTRSIRFTLLLLLPLILVILVISDRLLLLFGRLYSDNAAQLLRILVAAIVPWGINYLYISIERVRKNTKGIIAVTAAATGLSLGLSYLLMVNMGLMGVGVGYVAGQTAVAIAVAVHLWRRHQTAGSMPHA